MTHKQKAIELLGEKYQDYDFNRMSFVESLTDYEQGSNQMHSKAVDVVVGLLERVDELREYEKLFKQKIDYGKLICPRCEKRTFDSELRKPQSELQSAKERIGVLNTKILEMGYEDIASSKRIGELEKRVEDLLILQKKFGDYRKEKIEELKEELEACRDGNTFQKKRYYMLKNKLTVGKIERIIKKNGIQTRPGSVYTIQIDYLATAILKYLEDTNDK